MSDPAKVRQSDNRPQQLHTLSSVSADTGKNDTYN